MKQTLWLIAASALILSGCGDTTADRTVTGAGIGAGAGAIIGAVTGLGPATGAIVGAAAGGVTGMVTDRNQVDLGDSPWQSSDADAAPPQNAASAQPAAGPVQQAALPAPAADPATVKSIQAGLARLGFDPGPADGVLGAKTRAAIREFQQQNGIPANGEATAEVARKINEQVAARSH